MPRFEENSDYDPTESDEDYTENEKILLSKVRNRASQDSDDSDGEVLGVGSGSEEAESDEDQSDIAVSDVEDANKDELPDVRAWGKKKNHFYNTDYVDQDYGGFQGKDAHLAELEEEEARNLQQQLAQQLDDDDFQLDIPCSKKIEDDKVIEEIVKNDVSKLSKRQKIQILRKESPEFFGLVEDFESQMNVIKNFLGPVLDKYKKGAVQNSPAMEFVIAQHQLIMNYCVNIYMYLLLKASRSNVQNHPVIKRLYQYRQFLAQLGPIFEEVIKPQIDAILEEKTEAPVKKTLKIVKQLTEKAKAKRKASEKGDKPAKKVKFDEKLEIEKPENENSEMNEEEDGEVGKRAITYKMAKNKGLTPHRKKDQRNPRVKHRNKFRKAKIRRRGAVREPRTEMTRYGGESSGIKASVTKSIKIK